MRWLKTSRSPGSVSSARAGTSVPGMAPVFLGAVCARGGYRLVDRFGVGLADPVASRNEPQAAGIAAHGIQVEGQFDRAIAAWTFVAVRVPNRVADVEIAVARHVVEIFPQQAGSDAFDALVIEECAQVGMQVDKGQQSRVALVVVRVLMVAAAAGGPNCFESLGDGRGFSGKEPGEAQVAEEIEKAHLLFG